eukprot:10360187-Prorocentrum_lima.AAC.1
MSWSRLSLRVGELDGLARRRLSSASWRASPSLSAPCAGSVPPPAAEAAGRPVPFPPGGGPKAAALRA